MLLPVRLETRFVGPGRPPRWRLRVRVVPDAVSITTHDDVPSAVELDAVEAMWRAAGGATSSRRQGGARGATLAAAVGAERAAWLARTFPPVTGPDGAITITRPSADADRHARPARDGAAADDGDLDRPRRRSRRRRRRR